MSRSISPGSTGCAESPALQRLTSSELEEGASSSSERPLLTEDDSRPRFNGNARKWKRLVQAEIDLAASLDDLEEDDLSIHLYNAHALKRQYYARGSKQPEIKPWNRRQRWTAPQYKNDWVPRASWTAWPLEPERVPHQEERFFSDRRRGARDDWYGGNAWELPVKPSQDLENCLLDEILKQVRFRFYEKAERSPHHERPAKRQRLHREVNEEPQVGQTTGASAGSNGPIHHPCNSMVLDETDAHFKARPVIRHIISTYEGLLRSLQLSRRNQDRAEFSDAESRSRSQDAESSGTSRSPAARQRPTKVHPRDWSEVLGLAAMTGWDQGAVSRAAARCSALFDEKMDFTIFNNEQPSNRPPHESTEQLQSQSLRDKVVPGFDFHSLACPVAGCDRHTKPYNSRWRLNEHLKRNHGIKFSLRNISPEPQPQQDDTFGGVHIDGFLQRIQPPAQWRPRKRSVGSEQLEVTDEDDVREGSTSQGDDGEVDDTDGSPDGTGDDGGDSATRSSPTSSDSDSDAIDERDEVDMHDENSSSEHESDNNQVSREESLEDSSENHTKSGDPQSEASSSRDSSPENEMITSSD